MLLNYHLNKLGNLLLLLLLLLLLYIIIAFSTRYYVWSNPGWEWQGNVVRMDRVDPTQTGM